MECQCEKSNSEDAATGLWLSSNSFQMGAFTVAGYLLYRFSQTLPALIRWPIRLFCSLTGLSTLWSWVSRLVGTVRVIQTLYKWMCSFWRFILGISCKFKWLAVVSRAVTGSCEDGAPALETEPPSSVPNKPGLRLIILGPAGEERSALSELLLGKSETRSPMYPLMESRRRRTVIDSREVTVIHTPDVLGPSLGDRKRAMEALRSLQLASPGPHAFLLVIRAPSDNMRIEDAAQAIQATLELYGDAATEHVIPVLIHTGRLARKHANDPPLDVDAEGLKMMLFPCQQKPELVDGRPNGSPEAQSVTRRKVMGCVMEMKTLRGHFIHELQRREDCIREELLADMASRLARKLEQT
ncbi:GTPase IMAP family member 4-like [Brachionichthys hirsutus]|uniref:GTPase IMAP family member 4-like n=1 Tax=Brachionichthys hirsutus TaxID=412623 RepID=UPI003604D288